MDARESAGLVRSLGKQTPYLAFKAKPNFEVVFVLLSSPRSCRSSNVCGHTDTELTLERVGLIYFLEITRLFDPLSSALKGQQLRP